jgi:hypothetical protein
MGKIYLNTLLRIRIPGSKTGSKIWDKHPGSATLATGIIYKSIIGKVFNQQILVSRSYPVANPDSEIIRICSLRLEISGQSGSVLTCHVQSVPDPKS